MWLGIALVVIPSTSFKTGLCQTFVMASNQFNAEFSMPCIVTGTRPTILIGNRLRRLVMSSVTIIHMGTLLSMKPWSAWVRTGSCAILWLICMGTMVPWMGTQPRLCVIPKLAYPLLRLNYCVISSKKRSISSLTSMIQKKSQPFCQRVSQIS